MKKRLVLAIIVMAAIAVVGVWFGFRKSPPTATYTGPADKITVANIGVYSIFNLIAKEKGYFAGNGLAVQVDEYDSGATSIKALQTGKADFAIAADFVGVSQMFADKDIRILATASHHDVFRVIAKKDRGVIVPSDLKGKKIGLTRKTAGEFYLGRFLALNGLRLEDVDITDLSPADMTVRFENGELDAILIFDPHAHAIEERLGNAVVGWSAQGDQKAIAVVYTTRSFIERRPDLAERYLRALVEAERYATANGAETRQLVARILDHDDAYVAYMWPKFSFSIELGQDLLLTMEDQARWKMDNGLADRGPVPNYLDVIHFDALEKAKPGAVTIIH